MRKLTILLFCMLIFAAGCTEKKIEKPTEVKQSTSGEIEELNSKIMELERKLSNTEESLKVLEEMIMSHDGLGYGELRLRQRLVEDLVSHLPEIEIRTGFIRQINEESVIVDYAEKIVSAEAPNGLEIINDSEEAEEIEIVKNMTVFVLNGTDMEARTVQEFVPMGHFFPILHLQWKCYTNQGRVCPVT